MEDKHHVHDSMNFSTMPWGPVDLHMQTTQASPATCLIIIFNNIYYLNENNFNI